MVYALKDKKRFEFLCVSKTKEELDKKIQQFYWNRSGMRPKGTKFTMEDLMEDYIRVEVTVRRID